MRLASADFTWPGLRPEFVLDLIAELDLEGVSMAFMGGYTARRPEDVAEDPEGRGERVAGELAQRGLRAADVFLIPRVDLVGLTVNHPDPAEREQAGRLFTDFLRFARRVGSTGMTILPGMVFGGEPWHAAFDRSVEGLRRRLELTREHDLRLSVEPHIVSTHPYAGSVADTPERVQRLVDAVPGLELTLDYGHFNVQGIPDREVEPLISHARHFHMRGGARGLVQTKFEDNVTDFGRVLDRMAETGYDGWVEIEYVHDARPGCSSCDNIQEVRKFRDFVREHEAAREREGAPAPA
ncbi:MAG: sugar phosphate isomerase/epimerase family protein [Solirubrobacteraceae bacterium]